MAHNQETVLGIVKARLNRLASDTSLDTYLTQRIQAADSELERTGIRLQANDVEDQVFLADYVAWQYQNRDKPGSMPEWLKLRRRERWLQQRQRDEEAEDDS
jgi:hypothetical protein